ncbi:long-chain fatty acid--CoA ligase [Bacillus sp. 31A1R]|uniref:Long-chain fatty acid--CoA ligase n=1 Tax=Robertmurraya mangrovi TaxID=3098077 RepID=A0ABU5ISY5_9BACI|nr:long-chain fatty acid--CoA ligase [Bacillus sp. 31A1R]MDZ5470257.1 long-chain fatty acid--CoA ligase [Bacillus sp. 31A1R]
MVRWELDWLENRARLAPDSEAVIDADISMTWTYSELNNRCNRVANWLVEKGIRKGDRVALLSPNDICYLDLLFACGKIGAIFVPLNWRLSTSEIRYILEDSTPKLLGYHSSFTKTVADLNEMNMELFKVEKESYFKDSGFTRDIPISEEDPLAIIYTGGTTGKPKGVVLSHRSILWNGLNTILSWNLTSEDTTLTYMPMFHTGGLNALSIPLLMIGGKVVIAKEFDPHSAICYLNKYQCTIVLFVPTMYHMLVETDEFKGTEFPTIKAFLSGGAPCPLEIYEAFNQKGLQFKEGYGLTEAGPNNFFIETWMANEKRGSVGKPMMFNQIQLLKEDGTVAENEEVGEVLIKGKHSFEFYWKNEDATKETLKQGWLHTGDLAKRDNDGYFYIVGRKKDMIITGGENVYPLEVEHWIAAHPEVSEVAVVGLPDSKWGEIVTAFIVLKNNASLSVEEIKNYCSYKLGNYKIPKKIIFIKELPKTHVGKIDKNQLKQSVEAK